MLAWAKSLLGHVPAYVGLQKVIGADRLRYRCIEDLKLQPGERVLDVGCGPAYYFERLGDVKYTGFDTDERYIAWANGRWGDRADFRCEILTEDHLASLPKMDAVMLLGLLHHLSDEDSSRLLRIVAGALAPGGRVISVDTCFEPTQGKISHWMSANDRGEYVRRPEQFVDLARRTFGDVDGEVLNETTRIPSSHWLMRMRTPVAAAPATGAVATERVDGIASA
jgi:SAM-dependent methyltransferase